MIAVYEIEKCNFFVLHNIFLPKFNGNYDQFLYNLLKIQTTLKVDIVVSDSKTVLIT